MSGEPGSVKPVTGVEVNFLTGRYVATAYNDRGAPEWPPHPARLFSALVATWAEAWSSDADGRTALEWLEGLGPPEIAASQASPRTVARHFVPANDASIVSPTLYRTRSRHVIELQRRLDRELSRSAGQETRRTIQISRQIRKKRDVAAQVTRRGKTPPESARRLFPDGRQRHERSFPSCTPEDPRVVYMWNKAAPPRIRRTLDRLLAQVVRIGHSSSLVSCRLASAPPAPTLLPRRLDNARPLRCVAPGQVRALERQFERHHGARPRSLPFISVQYGEQAVKEDPATVRPNNAGPWLTFEFAPGARHWPATRTVDVSRVMRQAVLSHADEPIPEGISGHRGCGRPTLDPHLSIVPLPFVGMSHADGLLRGLALMLPRSSDAATERALYRAVGTWEQSGPMRLTFGDRGALELRRLLAPSELSSVRRRVWSRHSKAWVSVTPIALPRHPGRLTGGTQTARSAAWRAARASVAVACLHSGLPTPETVSVSLAPLLAGARPVRDFPLFAQTAGSGRPIRRQLLHASVQFRTEVSGPLILGTGRFLGLGLMRPVDPGGRSPRSGP